LGVIYKTLCYCKLLLALTTHVGRKYVTVTNQGSLTEGEGLTDTVDLRALTSLDQVFFKTQTLFPFVQNKLP
jgi:hypothetical protein